MDIVLLLKAAIMGVVEGLTEFLPISSTGHLILAGALLGFDDAKAKVFDIAIQTGAIFAVILVYWERIRTTVAALPTQRQAQRFALNVLIGFLPAVVLGLLLGKAIKAHLFNAPTVAATFIVGGLIILWAERRTHRVRIQEVEDLTAVDALKLGLAQALALIPGTSRSGATIVGGLFFGLSRRAAIEFSFFLAIPTILLASAYQLYKERHLLVIDDLGMWAVGFLTAFVSAFWAVRALLRYISTHDFTLFAWYRIAFGLLILVTWHYDLIAWS